jgi:hypothetical protein
MAQRPGYEKAGEPKIVVRDSAASRNSAVEMALSFSASMGTSTKDFLRVSTKVPPAGMTVAEAILVTGGRDRTLGVYVSVPEGEFEGEVAENEVRVVSGSGQVSRPAAEEEQQPSSPNQSTQQP